MLSAWILVPGALLSETLIIKNPIVVNARQTGIAPLDHDQIVSEQESQLEINDVVLEDDATLILPPFRSIVINRLIASQGSRIQLAQSQEQGANSVATSAQVFVRSIRGHILIESRGMDGEDGRHGRQGRQGAEGKRGRNARTLLFGLLYLQNGENGGPGLAGEPGEDGHHGGDGGAGGAVSLYYVEKTLDSKIVVDVSGGRAGRGGRGGLGGLGGMGGRGGEGIRDGRQGPMGVMGPSGRAGIPGRPGRPGTASIYQLPRELFVCLMTLDARSLVEPLHDDDYEHCRGSVSPRALETIKVDQVSHQPLEKSWAMDLDGVFYVNADGQNGKDAPSSVGAGVSAENATSGSHGGHLVLLFRTLPEKVLITARGGRGGVGSEGRGGASGGDGFDGRNAGLFHKATAGTPGQNGQNGGYGSHGGHGGSGGSVKIIYIPSRPEDFVADWAQRFEIDVAGGDAGQGGRGANGGRPGRGGRGGKKFWSDERMPDGVAGHAGLPGQSGTDGDRGSDGTIEWIEADHLGDWIIEAFRREVEARDQNPVR